MHAPTVVDLLLDCRSAAVLSEFVLERAEPLESPPFRGMSGDGLEGPALKMELPKSATTELVKVLSFNVGLLYIQDPFFGVTFFHNPPHGRERLPRIPDAIREVDADVVLLQECYFERDADFLWRSLHDVYPFKSRLDCPRTWLQLHNGLMVLSKWPITKERFDKYRDAARLEQLLGCKGNLATTIRLGSQQLLLTFINGHYTAGGERINSDDPGSDLDREKELAQTVELAKAVAEAGEVPLLCGDFNCGPEASTSNYSGLLKRGFRDLFVEANGTAAAGPESFTWCPTNYLNTLGPHAHCPGQRLDHLFLPTDLPAAKVISCTAARLVLKEPCVPLPGVGHLCTLSDHCGVLWTLSLD